MRVVIQIFADMSGPSVSVRLTQDKINFDPLISLLILISLIIHAAQS